MKRKIPFIYTYFCYALHIYSYLLANHKMFHKHRIAILGRGMEGQSTYRFLRQQGILDASIGIFDQHTDKVFPE